MDELPSLRVLPNGLFMLRERWTYHFPWNPSVWVEIPRGHITDFATIPWFARWLISETDKTILIPSLIHDYLVGQFPYEEPATIRQHRPGGGYYYERPSWDKAAFILKHSMEAEGAPRWKRMIVHWAVRFYGRFRK